jgi:CheY-like chemotaxis protein
MSDTAQKRILLADDEAVPLQVFPFLIREVYPDAIIETAADFASAKQKVLNEPPYDLIISDVNLLGSSDAAMELAKILEEQSNNLWC